MTTYRGSPQRPTIGLFWGIPGEGEKARKKGELESGESNAILPLYFRTVSPSSSLKANHLKIPAFLVVLLTIVRSFIKTKTLHATIRSLDSIPRTYPDLCCLP